MIGIFIKIIAVYVIFFVLLVICQRNLVFQPSKINPFDGDIRPFTPITYKTPMGLNLRGAILEARPGKPTIVYFQGNAGNLGDRFGKAMMLSKEGAGIALAGYRGYSGNPGAPSEMAFYEDARAFIESIKARNVREEDIIFYGESLGTGVATQMAKEYPKIKALVLEAPYTSIASVAKERFWFFPVTGFMKDRFDSAAKIGSLKMPVLILHGKDDRVIPYKFGEELFSHVTAPVKQFVSFDTGQHADLYELGAAEAVNAFVAKL